jgi:NADPH:quinone reductase-like Zn-dependent oxidoreductase
MIKAAVREEYCSPEHLRVKSIPKPVPGKGEIGVRVMATTINRTDCAVLTGEPFIMRFFTGLKRPTRPVPGTDFAGVVDAVGPGVTAFQPGDRIWGFDDNGIGSQGEYMVIAAKRPISRIPEGISFAGAAASAEAAHYALNFLRKVQPQAGQAVLVNGGTGAIGSALIQMLAQQEVHITATAATPHLELVKGLGAHRVIDYTRENFLEENKKYHIIFDAVGKSTFGLCKPLLHPGGIYQSSELGPGNENLYLPLLTRFRKDARVVFPFPVDIPGSLECMGEMLRMGTFRPVISKTYRLEDIAAAYAFVASGQKTGNVVLDLS